MKNKLFLMIMVVMVCSLTACGQQENGSMTNTGNSTEQVVTSEDNSESVQQQKIIIWSKQRRRNKINYRM
ncbi:MAG: lipoprotein [Lachnospira eligens]